MKFKVEIMNKLITIDSVTQYNNFMGVETLHPLISIVDFSTLDFERINESYKQLQPGTKAQINMYAIFLKDVKCGNITYGLKNYDYEEGTLMFLAPGQVFGMEEEGDTLEGSGIGIFFHPDLIRGTSLGATIDDYSFFSYETNEALHLSARERELINTCIENIRYELLHSIDSHTKTLIVSHLEVFLNYCKRFYERQFNTRSHVNKDILSRFEAVLKEYFASDLPSEMGLPTVNYCAEKLFLSPNYLSDLLKKETGKSALEHIHFKMISLAKKEIFNSEKSISEIAYQLGFKYPQHFTRMFKKEVGVSPNDFRNLN